ncbi:MAG: LysR family transcriptional regulator [Streptosporangiales bacterium]|nr:LysR family transcriptional regulator [Streptosporangiales bacterium]
MAGRARTHLANLDLNLLVALRELIRERNVTRAAERIGITQPAASAALSRLRRHFGDELLVRGRGGHVLTPLSRQLAERAPRAALHIQLVRESGRTSPCAAIRPPRRSRGSWRCWASAHGSPYGWRATAPSRTSWPARIGWRCCSTASPYGPRTTSACACWNRPARWSRWWNGCGGTATGTTTPPTPGPGPRSSTPPAPSTSRDHKRGEYLVAERSIGRAVPRRGGGRPPPDRHRDQLVGRGPGPARPGRVPDPLHRCRGRPPRRRYGGSPRGRRRTCCAGARRASRCRSRCSATPGPEVSPGTSSAPRAPVRRRSAGSATRPTWPSAPRRSSARPAPLQSKSQPAASGRWNGCIDPARRAADPRVSVAVSHDGLEPA